MHLYCTAYIDIDIGIYRERFVIHLKIKIAHVNIPLNFQIETIYGSEILLCLSSAL